VDYAMTKAHVDELALGGTAHEVNEDQASYIVIAATTHKLGRCLLPWWNGWSEASTLYARIFGKIRVVVRHALTASDKLGIDCSEATELV
jgi:hypothetical protein